MSLLVFTPTFGAGPQRRTLRSVSAQECTQRVDHHVNWLTDPLPGRNVSNVVDHYKQAQKMCLAGDYEALVTVEHDMILPPNALQKLYDTDAPVVYGIYMLRHGTPTLNAWQYLNNHNLGMSLSLYPREVQKFRKRGWGEVCGVGWGCTLIRREVLKRITIHSNDGGDAGDLAFAIDCVRAGIQQIARFDVPCGHITPDGKVLEAWTMNAIVGRVLALASINVNVNGQSKEMKKDRYYTLPIEVASELARAGYVTITNDAVTVEVDRMEPNLYPVEMREKAVDPRAAKRSKRKS